MTGKERWSTRGTGTLGIRASQLRSDQNQWPGPMRKKIDVRSPIWKGASITSRADF